MSQHCGETKPITAEFYPNIAETDPNVFNTDAVAVAL